MLPADGVVLAGGQSRRMGRPKHALTTPSGVSLLASAWRVLTEACAGHVWVSGRESDPLRQYPEVVDRFPGLGPLAGIEAALSQCRQEWLCVLAVDLPFVPSSLFVSLYEASQRQYHADVLYPVASGVRHQPLAALWHVRSHSVVKDFLSSGQAPRVESLMERLPTATVAIDEPGWLLNVNTPDDWAAAQARWRP